MTASISGRIDDRRPLAGLLIAQFFGAFNDNAWKLIVFTLATRHIVIGADNFEANSQYQATLGFLLFLFPMLIFSLPAGILADKISKRAVIISMKLLELTLMGIAVIALFFFPRQLFLPYLVLALMGMQSALFGPAKYGVLPELLPLEKLTYGNGLLEMWTMVAIIGGTALGPLFLIFDREGAFPSRTCLAPFCLFLLSAAGFYAANFLPALPRLNNNDADKVIENYKKTLRAILHDRVLTLAIVGQAFYWLVISLLGQNVLVYAKALIQNLQRGEILQGIPLGSYGAGISIGAFLAGRVAKDRVEYGLIPLGSIGFAAMSITLGVLQPQILGSCLILILMGCFSGFVIVPLHTIVQWRAPKNKRGGVIAIGNICDILGMIAGSLLASFMAFAGLKLDQMLMLSSLLVIAATIWAVKLLPEALVRLLAILLTLTFYRVRLIGRENIPAKGPALIVCNHLSIVDALFILTAFRRHTRFIIKQELYDKWWIRPLAKLMGAIPVSRKNKSEAIKVVSILLERGELVSVFPEGQVSLTGIMRPFEKDIELIMKKRRCPIIPVHLDLVWGSIFSFKDGRFITKMPHSIPYPLTITVGSPLPAHTPTHVIRASILELSTKAWDVRKEREELAHRMFTRQARWKCLKTACFDSQKGAISRLKMLKEAIMLARRINKLFPGEKNMGVLLPAGRLGAIVNLALSFAGKTAVNLDPQHISFEVEAAGIKTILTVDNHSLLRTRSGAVDINDMMAKRSILSTTIAYFMSLFAPVRLLEKYTAGDKRRSINEPLAIIFSKKSRGIILSHYNVMANVEGLSQSLPKIGDRDKLLSALPLSSPFGYTQMWLGLIHDFELVFHHSAEEVPAIASLIQKRKVNMMFTAPKHLRQYLKEGDPEKFSHLNYILVAGGDPDSRSASIFESRFGLRPSIGYGLAECGFIIAIQVPNIRKKGLYQSGFPKTSAGHPIPGISIKIANPENLREVDPGQTGILLVKGPSIMLGYLGAKKPKITDNGYLVTDIQGHTDKDGNLFPVVDARH